MKVQHKDWMIYLNSRRSAFNNFTRSNRKLCLACIIMRATVSYITVTVMLHYYPFAVKLGRYVGSCNTLIDLSNKVCVPIKIEDLNE